MGSGRQTTETRQSAGKCLMTSRIMGHDDDGRTQPGIKGLMTLVSIVIGLFALRSTFAIV